MNELFSLDYQAPWFWLFVVFACMWLLQMIFYGLVFSRFAWFRMKTASDELPPVSIVISARNEYHNLSKFLKKVLQQDYPLFEVVLVNDHSDDDTIFLLQRLSAEYPHLTVINLRDSVNFFKGKKFPLSVGIKSARYDLLLFTDADCYPSGNTWIREMVAAAEGGKEVIVLGYGGYESRPGFLNALIRFDTLHTAMQYIGFARVGMPYMGVGRNVMYHRKLFYNAGGFTSHYTLPGGDDDLFINAVARKSNTRISISATAKTMSLPKENFADWKAQKKRHLSTSPSYRFVHKMLLGLYWLSHAVFYLCIIPLLILKIAWVYVLAAFFLRLFLQLRVNNKSMHLVGERNLLLFSPLVDILYLFLNPYVFLSSRIASEDKWK
jgi:glycosyltransferase involved in cell wall biosynthesis